MRCEAPQGADVADSPKSNSSTKIAPRNKERAPARVGSKFLSRTAAMSIGPGFDDYSPVYRLCGAIVVGITHCELL